MRDGIQGRRRDWARLSWPARLALFICALAVTAGCGGSNATVDTTDSPFLVAGEEASPSAAASAHADGGVVTIGRGQTYRITDDGATLVVHCDGGGDVDVLADGVTVKITGRGAELEVRGSRATIRAERMQEVDVVGSRNSVRIGRTIEVDVDGDGNTLRIDRLSEIDIDGHRNVVALGRVAREIEVSGDDNRVTWRSGSPEIDDEGRGNRIARQ